jgi:hypothetical protein
MIVVTIAGEEIAYLTHPVAALIVMAAACTAGLVAYERGS